MSRIDETNIEVKYPQKGKAYTANVRAVFAAIQLEFQNARTDIEEIVGGTIQVGNADLLDGQEGSFYQNAGNLNAGTLSDARVAESNVTQHQAALAISYSQMTNSIPDAQVPESAVTQHQAALSFTASQVAEISNLTAAEGAQLENINSVTISNTQWSYIGALASAPLEENDLASNSGNVPEFNRSNDFGSTVQQAGRWEAITSGKGFNWKSTDDSNSAAFVFQDSAGNAIEAFEVKGLDGAGAGHLRMGAFSGIEIGTVGSQVGGTLNAAGLYQADNPVLDTTDLAANGGSVVTNDETQEISGAIRVTTSTGSGTPALSFIGDTDTGFYHVISDEIGVSAGGNKVAVFNTSEVNVVGVQLKNKGNPVYHAGNPPPSSGQFRADDIEALQNLDDQVVDAAQVVVSSYYGDGWQYGGGLFFYDGDRAKSQHDGFTVISPTVPWTTTMSDFLNGVGETDGGGVGCFVRVMDAPYVTPYMAGAKYDGVTDDTASHQKLFNSGFSEIVLPSGQSIINDRLTITGASERAVSIKGAGMGSTRLYWPSGASAGGIKISHSDSAEQDYIHGLSLVTESVAAYEGIQIDRTAENDGTSVQNRTDPRTVIRDVELTGSVGPNTDGWNVGIRLINCMNASIFSVHDSGYRNSGVALAGIYIEGTYNPAEYSISDLSFYNVQYGIRIKESVEGVHCTNLNLVKVDTGIKWDATSSDPLIALSNSHINSLGPHVDLDNVNQFVIRGNLFYKQASADSSYASGGLTLTGCSYGLVSSNIFQNTSSENHDHVVVTDSNWIAVQGNLHQSGQTGIWFKSDSNNCSETDNIFINLNNANVVNNQ